MHALFLFSPNCGYAIEGFDERANLRYIAPVLHVDVRDLMVGNREGARMLVEFRRAEAAVQSSRLKFEYADDLVRVAARKFASDLSADCTACERTADTVGTLSSADVRSELYDAEAAKITQMSAYKSCP